MPEGVTCYMVGKRWCLPGVTQVVLTQSDMDGFYRVDVLFLLNNLHNTKNRLLEAPLLYSHLTCGSARAALACAPAFHAQRFLVLHISRPSHPY